MEHLRKALLFCNLLLIVNAYSNTVNVTNFGAIPNNLSFDYSDSIQSAINCLANGDILQIPAGNYTLSKQLYLNGKSNVVIIAQGAIMYLTQNVTPWTFPNGAPPLRSAICLYASTNVTISGLSIIGNFSTGIPNAQHSIPQVEGILVYYYSSGCKVLNCTVNNVNGDGIHFYHCCDNGIAENNYVAHTDLDGILFHSASNNGRISNNTINNTFIAIEVEGRIDSTDQQLRPCSNYTISNNIIDGTFDKGILIDWSHNVNIICNSFSNAKCIHFIGCSNSSVCNNIMNNCRYGVIAWKEKDTFSNQVHCSDLLVSNNSFLQSASLPDTWLPVSAHFYFKDASNITIINNTINIYDYTSKNIAIQTNEADNVVVRNNAISNYKYCILLGSNTLLEGNNLSCIAWNSPILLDTTPPALSNISIVNNCFEHGNGSITLGGNTMKSASNIIINNNRFKSQEGLYPIFVYRNITGCMISGNIFEESTKQAVYVDINQTITSLSVINNIAPGGFGWNGKNVYEFGNITQ
jgi:parallel beta-helix repeat protein